MKYSRRIPLRRGMPADQASSAKPIVTLRSRFPLEVDDLGNPGIPAAYKNLSGNARTEAPRFVVAKGPASVLLRNPKLHSLFLSATLLDGAGNAVGMELL